MEIYRKSTTDEDPALDKNSIDAFIIDDQQQNI
jgi:hypothetical protein